MKRIRKNGIRVNLKTQNGTIEDIQLWMKAHRILINHASKNLTARLVTDSKFSEKFFELNGKKFNYLVEWALRSKTEKTEYEALYDSLDLKLKRSMRIGALMASRFLKGDGQRNGETDDNGEYEHSILTFPAITRQNKAIHLTDGFVHLDTGKDYTFTEIESSRLVIVNELNFRLQTLNGFYHNMSASIPNEQKHLLQYVKNDSPGGNIFFTKKGNLTFQLLVDEPYETLYDYTPGKILGIDLNQRANVFVTCSDGTIYKRDASTQLEIEEVTSLLKQIGATQVITTPEGKEIRKRVLKSRQRRPLRRKWQTKFNAICRTLRNIVDEIIGKVEREKLLLCIDGVATGGSNSFGHAEIKKMLIAKCQEKNIPYVLVPSYHTSSDCAVCYENGNHSLVARSADYELVSCPTCEKNYNADINAAKIIAKDGVYIYLTTNKDEYKKNRKMQRPNAEQRKKMKFPKFVNYDVF